MPTFLNLFSEQFNKFNRGFGEGVFLESFEVAGAESRRCEREISSSIEY